MASLRDREAPIAEAVGAFLLSLQKEKLSMKNRKLSRVNG
jgi:hypothetical protein